MKNPILLTYHCKISNQFYPIIICKDNIININEAVDYPYSEDVKSIIYYLRNNEEVVLWCKDDIYTLYDKVSKS